MLSNATRADTKRKLLTKDVLAAVAAVAADAAAAPLAAVADADPSAAAAAEICDICFPACGVVAAARNSKEDPPKDVPPSQPGQPQAFPYRALASRRCASSAAQYRPPGVSPLGGDAAHARPHRAQTEGCLLAEDGGLFSVTAFAFLGAPRRRTARLEPGAGVLDAQRLTHGPHARVHGGFVSAVHFGAVQGLARERVVRGGEVRGAQKALVRVHATKRRVVLGETSSDCRGAQVALRARHAPLCLHAEVRARGVRVRVGIAGSRRQGGGRRETKAQRPVFREGARWENQQQRGRHDRAYPRPRPSSATRGRAHGDVCVGVRDAARATARDTAGQTRATSPRRLSGAL